ncbi:MAG: sugar phosphate isomerase/epimerase [Fulvivirga sp.]
MTNRNNFIKSNALVMAGLFLLAVGCTSKQKNQEAATDAPEETVAVTGEKSGVGVQIYSVRTELKEDFTGTMGKVGAMGYQYVEGYGMNVEGKILGNTATEYKKIVEDSGMELISCHSTYFTPEEASKIIEASKAAGLKYLIIPSLPKKLRNDYHKVAENLNKVGELFKGTGIKFGYHNHAFEFEKQGDKTGMEILLEETDPELVTFELDLYWVVKGGHDPMELINKYPGRFSLYHVKDANESLEQTTLGTGIIDFKALIAAKEKAGLEYYFVEDERTDDPLGNLEADFKHASTLK